MVNKDATVAIKTYNETWNKPIKPYKAIDFNGKIISIQPKNKSKHESEHPVEQMPTYFYNLDQVIKNPDSVKKSKSQTPIAKQNSKKGRHYEFRKEGYVESLNIPGQDGKNEETLVVVYYGNDGVNFTRTFRTEVKHNE